jgi:hypothetical protein
MGIFQGLGSNGLVVGQSERKSTVKKQPGLSHWTSMIEAINALGRFLDPLVILKGKETQQQWFPEDMEYLTNWNFTSSLKGWTSDEIGLEWLREVFIPSSKPEKANEKRLLILDGHGSHATGEFMRLCVANRIQLVYLPPHTTHVLQPLDIAIFGPLKRAYQTQLALATEGLHSAPMRKETFLRCYFEARKIALNESNIKAGWRGSGLWPMNVNKPLGSRFVVEDPNDTITVEIGNPSPPRTNQRSRRIKITTPHNSRDLHSLAVETFKLDHNSPTVRRLFRAIDRGFSSLTYENAMLKAENTTLKQARAQSKKKPLLKET